MTNNILFNFSEYLKDTNIFKVLLPIIDEFRYTFKKNEELKQAVKEWCENKEKAVKKYGHIKIWNTRFITDMSNMFKDTSFNDDISNWDTSNVTNMSNMFEEESEFNQPLNWNTSNVINMCSMFDGCVSFNQHLNFDTKNVVDMSYMFKNAESFNQPLNFNTEKVTYLEKIFDYCPISEENKCIFLS